MSAPRKHRRLRPPAAVVWTLQEQRQFEHDLAELSNLVATLKEFVAGLIKVLQILQGEESAPAVFEVDIDPLEAPRQS